MTKNWFMTEGVKFDGLWIDMYVYSGKTHSYAPLDTAYLVESVPLFVVYVTTFSVNRHKQTTNGSVHLVRLLCRELTTFSAYSDNKGKLSTRYTVGFLRQLVHNPSRKRGACAVLVKEKHEYRSYGRSP